MTATIREEITIRPATTDDLVDIVALTNAGSLIYEGTASLTLEELQREYTLPDFNLAHNVRVATNSQGKVIGVVEIWDINAPYVRINLWGRVHPDYEGQGISSRLLELGEEVARAAIGKAPEGTRVYVGTGTPDSNPKAIELLTNSGYTEVRRFWRMRIDMDAPPPPPVLPEGIRIVNAKEYGDERMFYTVMQEAFKDHWGHLPWPYEQWEHYVHNPENYDPTLWFLALEGDQPAGISINIPKVAEESGMGWVDDLGVLRPWRRKGLGLALLHHSFDEFYRRGYRKVGLAVDSESLTGATRLYEKAGMRPFKSWIRFEKTLREGIELAAGRDG